jgi:hypothetical protein
MTGLPAAIHSSNEVIWGVQAIIINKNARSAYAGIFIDILRQREFIKFANVGLIFLCKEATVFKNLFQVRMPILVHLIHPFAARVDFIGF